MGTTGFKDAGAGGDRSTAAISESIVKGMRRWFSDGDGSGEAKNSGMRIPAQPVHRTMAGILGTFVGLCVIASTSFFGFDGFLLVVPLVVILTVCWYWGSFRSHWRIMYECDQAGLRLIRYNKVIEEVRAEDVSQVRENRGAVTIRLKNGRNILIHPAHSAQEIASLLGR